MQRTDCEVREGINGTPVITGYAAVFNRDSADMGFIEQVDPAAFNRTINNGDIIATFNHDPNQLLGRSKNGTLRLQADGTGLRYEIDVNPTDPDAQRVLAKIRRGDVSGASFSFNSIRDEWNWDSNPPQRRLLEVQLHELGPVVKPAYPDATAAARALEPIAKQVHRPVDELVEALKTGEIRSMIDEYQETWGEERAVWSTAMVNNLPDSAFLYVEDGGEKDSDGKTVPRTLRHFPYKDASGKVDLPHLRNALARIPQSNLPASVKDSLTAKAKKILSANGGEGNSMDDLIEEMRAGKMLSAANIDYLESVVKSLRDLIDVAKKGSPMDSSVGSAADGTDDEGDDEQPMMGRGLGLVANEMRLRELKYAAAA